MDNVLISVTAVLRSNLGVSQFCLNDAEFIDSKGGYLVVILVPDDKLDCFGRLENCFCLIKNGLAFYPGPVMSPRTDGSSLNCTLNQIKFSLQL